MTSIFVFFPNNSPGRFVSYYPFEARRRPLGVPVETDLLVEVKEIGITIDDIKSDATLEFAETDRTEMQGSGVAFL
jgi:hypothetical protein